MYLIRASRRSSRSAARRLAFAAVLGLAVVLAGCASSGRGEGAKAAPNDPELGRGLDDLARSYEALDVNRIMPLYAQGDYALAWDNQMSFATGTAEHRSLLARALGDAKTLKVTLDPNFDAWRDDDRAWTSRKFTAVGTKKNGEKIEFAGWHSAIWERQNGKWLIWYEHFAASPKPTPAPPPPPPPPPAPVATPVPAPPVVTLPFGDVYFDFDKWAIRKDQHATLEANLDLLRKNPDVRILLEGHCDERGGETYNYGLGDRRAEAVRRYLVGKGIEPGRLAVVSYGKQRPFELGHGEPAWGKNRRTHFVTMQK